MIKETTFTTIMFSYPNYFILFFLLPCSFYHKSTWPIICDGKYSELNKLYKSTGLALEMYEAYTYINDFLRNVLISRKFQLLNFMHLSFPISLNLRYEEILYLWLLQFEINFLIRMDSYIHHHVK
jgi:hypothetical protein